MYLTSNIQSPQDKHKSFDLFENQLFEKMNDNVWSSVYLIDNIFNDLMDKSIEGRNGNKITNT